MSKLDELLIRAPFADDGMSASFYTREEIIAARTELAALRRRAEDAEWIVRCPAHQYAHNGPKLMCIVTLRHPTIEPYQGVAVWLEIDPTTGLPILTDEARKAMQPPPTT